MPNAKPGQVTVAIAVTVAVTVAVAVTIDVEVQLKVEVELGPRLFGVRTECGLPQKIRERERDLRLETRDRRPERLENSNCRCLWHKIAREVDKVALQLPSLTAYFIANEKCVHTLRHNQEISISFYSSSCSCGQCCQLFGRSKI